MNKKIIHLSTILLMMLIVLSSCGNNRIAQNPSLIASEAGFNLPDYSIISQDNNMDRGASAWSEYSWKLKLNEPLSEKKF